MNAATAAVVTVGTELVTGLLVDTNTSEVSLALVRAGVRVIEAVSVPDDEALLAATLRRLIADADIVVVTGGLGPTHDDITREATAAALGIPLVRDPVIEAGLARWAARHTDARASERILVQADVLHGARVLPALLGTAPGQVVATPRGSLVLLPGPPREMRPLLAGLSAEWGQGATPPAILRCAAVSESDVQVATQDVLGGRADVELTVLAAPGDVRVVLFDHGVGAKGLAAVARDVAARLGPLCYSTDGSSLAETVLRLAHEGGETLGTAESCTGGLVAAALTAVPGASDVFTGSIVSYSDRVKMDQLHVPPGMLAQYGAVSEHVARAMAEGARAALDVSLALAVTGIAGPGGGSDAKPVGTVWFAVSSTRGTRCEQRHFPGDREIVRARSAALGLDLLRRSLQGL
ncbi:MAG: nicotinamide-nucleotide amidohydrolase family protein [Coriobacteriia bacterium]|nr:nicotinamide-nucleotide amidohydrolase family protein [Coriobacteriia bacterium]